MKNAKTTGLILGFLLLILVLLSICLGSVPVPLRDLLKVLRCTFTGKSIPDDLRGSANILMLLRLPRTVMMMLAGAALGCSGASYQGLFRNPLADPYLIGVSAGAGLGAVISLSVPHTTALLTPAFAFCFGLAAVGAVILLGNVRGTAPVTGMLLAGIAVNALASAATNGWMLLSGEELRKSFSWMLGGGGIAGWNEVGAAAPLILISILGQYCYAYPLNGLQFGEEDAAQLGISVRNVRLGSILFSTLGVAAAISFNGIIGFIGLVVPHILRLWIGGDYRRLIPLSALGGAFGLLLADILARTILAPRELPVGIITALIGAPFFLWLLRHSSGED